MLTTIRRPCAICGAQCPPSRGQKPLRYCGAWCAVLGRRAKRKESRQAARAMGRAT